jgi:hypothetical protein
MRRIDDRLRVEARRYLFRFGCPSCAYFAEETRRCSEGYPTEAHLSEALDEDEIIFCKLFEGA